MAIDNLLSVKFFGIFWEHPPKNLAKSQLFYTSRIYVWYIYHIPPKSSPTKSSPFFFSKKRQGFPRFLHVVFVEKSGPTWRTSRRWSSTHHGGVGENGKTTRRCRCRSGFCGEHPRLKKHISYINRLIGIYILYIYTWIYIYIYTIYMYTFIIHDLLCRVYIIRTVYTIDTLDMQSI